MPIVPATAVGDEMLGTVVGVMLNVTLAFVAPAALVAVTVAVVGPPLDVAVPEITPVLALIDSPVGIPLAVNVIAAELAMFVTLFARKS